MVAERQRVVEDAADRASARRGAVLRQDYMHAKVTVSDDYVFTGSFNLSHSGEVNAENVLEVRDPELAERLASFVDEIRGRYEAAPLPQDDIRSNR